MLTQNRTHIPTVALTSLPALLDGLGALLRDKPLPDNVGAAHSAQDLELSRGKSTLIASKSLVTWLKTQHTPVELAHLIRLTPQVLSGTFRLARQDYLSCGLVHGRFLLAAEREDRPRIYRRICRAIGLDPSCLTAQKYVKHALEILHRIVFKTTVSGHGTLELDGLVTLTDEVRQTTSAELGDGSRGGIWRIAQIAPELHKLGLERWASIPNELIETSDHYAFRTSVAVLAQCAMTRSDTVELTEQRIMTDAGLHQPSQSGRARARAYLKRGIDLLATLGIVAIEQLASGVRWAFRALKPDEEGDIEQHTSAPPQETTQEESPPETPPSEERPRVETTSPEAPLLERAHALAVALGSSLDLTFQAEALKRMQAPPPGACASP